MNREDCVYGKNCKNRCSGPCKRFEQFNRLLELSNLPKRYRKPIKIYAVNEDQSNYLALEDIRKDIVSFVSKGKNLYICSHTCGNAKTTWAVKLMLKYFDQTWHNSYDVCRGLFVHVPTLLLDLKNFRDPKEYLELIMEADVVVWDDIAAAKLTDYEHSQLLQFIDSRLNNEQSNIFTSNVTTEKELSELVGERLASRIYNTSQIVEFFAKDFRIGRKIE